MSAHGDTSRLVCSDEKNLAWGKLRNSLADYQVTSGGNRADYNDDPRVHEVPEFYCLDPSFWSPDLLIPTNYRLPSPRRPSRSTTRSATSTCARRAVE